MQAVPLHRMPFLRRVSVCWWKRVAARLADIVHYPLWLEHVGHVYTVDWLWLFAATYGTLQACQALVLLTSLGAPISWNRLRFGQQLPWLGLPLDLTVPA